MSLSPDEQWRKAAVSWGLRRSPLRPAAEDVAIFDREFRRWRDAARRQEPAVVLLGVTQEIAEMPWPAGTRVVAVDESRVMIRGLWRGTQHGYPAVCGRWQALPFADRSQDAAIGDGCYSVLAHDRYRAVTADVRRVLREDGLLIMRFFTRPEQGETVTSVFDDLRAGRIGNFHVFKWRLAMAMHGTLAEGAHLARIWETWHAAVPDPARLAHELDWPLREVLTIDDFRGLDARYTFPTLAEVRDTLSAAFEEFACRTPTYELGERCPILVCRPRQQAPA